MTIHPTNAMGIRHCPYFLALVTEDYVSDPDCLEQAEFAAQLGKAMYAIVKKGVDISPITKYNWKKIYYYEDASEFEKIVEDVAKEVNND